MQRLSAMLGEVVTGEQTGKAKYQWEVGNQKLTPELEIRDSQCLWRTNTDGAETGWADILHEKHHTLLPSYISRVRDLEGF